MQLEAPKCRKEVGAQLLDLQLGDALVATDRGAARTQNSVDVPPATTALTGGLEHGCNQALPAIAAVLVLAGEG